ncbi:MAG: hypothetical protein AAF092_08545 [Pseudomonadota bacterium]
MRTLIACLFFASPAAAWDFMPGLPCLLTHSDPALDIALTHDPTQPLYTIALTRDAPWPEGESFSLAFANGITISTPFHALTNDGRTVTVADRGFGNVIIGLMSGGIATAILGPEAVPFSAIGAAEPTRAFAACTPPPAA